MPSERSARTRIRVAPGSGGTRASVRTEVSLSDPTASGIRPMVVDHDPHGARVSLVPDGALLLAGDRIELDVAVAAGARLDLIEPGGTVAFPMHGASATWDVRITVAAGATLTWAGEPFIVSAGADARRTTHIRCAAGGRLALRETLVLGRHGEAPGAVRQRLSAADADGRLILVEDLPLDASTAPVLLGDNRVISTVLVLGAVPDGSHGPERFELDHPAAVQWRSLDADTHGSRVGAAWASALDALTAAG